MRLYLAGPMTGIRQWNFPEFDAAATALREQGHEVINPAELDRDAGFDETDPTYERGGWKASSLPSSFMGEAARRDVESLLKVDGVAVLSGWKASTGARLEVAIAQWLGLPVFRAWSLTPVVGKVVTTLDSPSPVAPRLSPLHRVDL